MTDMRATERLLEVLSERVAEVDGEQGSPHPGFAEIREILTELRRRGDTIVRRDDLRAFIEAEHDDESTYCRTEAEHATINAARARLENALGGKMQ